MFKVTKHFLQNVMRSEQSTISAKFDQKMFSKQMGYCPFGIFVNAWDFTPSHKDFTSHTVHNIPIRFEFGDIVSTSIQEMI